MQFFTKDRTISIPDLSKLYSLVTMLADIVLYKNMRSLEYMHQLVFRLLEMAGLKSSRDFPQLTTEHNALNDALWNKMVWDSLNRSALNGEFDDRSQTILHILESNVR